MIHSMTGFARVEKQVGDHRLVWELRSVNHRYLDIQLRLPETFRQLEMSLRARAADALGRGKFEAVLHCQKGASSTRPMELDFERLTALRTVLTDLGKVVEAAPPDLLAIMAWPGILREYSLDPTVLIRAADLLFTAALQDFDTVRAAEGTQMKAYIERRLAALDAIVSQLCERQPYARQDTVEKLRARCDELTKNVDEARLAQEVAIIAQRMDIDEEISRLKVHLCEMRDVLNRAEPVGRRLDFLLQELNRESNTLSSKSQDKQMTFFAVEMKVLIEQIREQVQNIE